MENIVCLQDYCSSYQASNTPPLTAWMRNCVALPDLSMLVRTVFRSDVYFHNNNRNSDMQKHETHMAQGRGNYLKIAEIPSTNPPRPRPILCRI